MNTIFAFNIYFQFYKKGTWRSGNHCLRTDKLLFKYGETRKAYSLVIDFTHSQNVSTIAKSKNLLFDPSNKVNKLDKTPKVSINWLYIQP